MPKGKDVIGLAKDKQAVMVDMKFMDFLGLWQHFTIPIAELSEGVFEEGLGFDGSSIRGWMPIHASDMLVVPDPDTALMDPFMKDPTLSLICNVVDPITKENYARDPRFIAQKAERYLKQSGVGDVAYYGPEAEFFIFDGVSYDSGPTTRTTRSSPARASGRPAPPSSTAGTARRTPPVRTWGTSRGTRKATSPSRPSTRCRTSAPRCAG
jgi:glutamine synthetase